jgi:hypothetical protein
MVQSLEQYVAQATQAIQPAQTAIQGQLDALSGQLDSTNERINRSYAQQQAGLDRQRNAAAETASLQAAGSGGSFGGSANLANRRYYDRSFVPAQTQLQTNQANDLTAARQASDKERTNLNTQLSNSLAQANQSALEQYYNDQRLEKQLAEQRRAAQAQAAAQNAYNKYLMESVKNKQNNGVGKNWYFGNGYCVQEFVDNAGNRYAKYYGHGDQEMDAGDFVWETNQAGTPWNLWNDIWGNGVNTYGINSNDITKLGGR